MNDFEEYLNPYFIGTTEVLTNNGFIPITNIAKSNSIFYISKNKLCRTKNYDILATSCEYPLSKYTFSKNSTFFGNSVLLNFISDSVNIYVSKDVKYINVYNTDIPAYIYLTYAFLFLNYFSYSSADKTFNFNILDSDPTFGYTVNNTIGYIYDRLNKLNINIPICKDNNITYKIKADVFPINLKEFISCVFYNFECIKDFLSFLVDCKLVYMFNSVYFLRCKNIDLAKFMLFLLSLMGFNPVLKANKDIYLIYFDTTTSNKNINYFNSNSIGYNISLPIEGAKLITLTNFNGFSTITYVPSIFKK